MSIGYVAGMKFSQADAGSGHVISGYESRRIFVNDQAYGTGLIVSPGCIVTDWGPERAADLAPHHFEALVETDPQIIILGTGERQVFPDPQAYLAVLQQGLGVEVMDTGAACRTYNILMSEGRKVTAGLILC
jgi:uncharacterized protein